MHLTGTEGLRIAHPASFLCAQAYIMWYRNTLKIRCTHRVPCIKMCAPASQIMHTGCRVHRLVSMIIDN